MVEERIATSKKKIDKRFWSGFAEGADFVNEAFLDRLLREKEEGEIDGDNNN